MGILRGSLDPCFFAGIVAGPARVNLAAGFVGVFAWYWNLRGILR